MDRKINPVANNVNFLIAAYKKALQLNKYVHVFEEAEDEDLGRPLGKSKTMMDIVEVETAGSKVQEANSMGGIVAASQSKVAKFREFSKHHFLPSMKPYHDLID